MARRSFLGGQSAVRPFGAARLDGVDLDIEGGAPTGYGAYVRALRALMATDGAHRHYISGAPRPKQPGGLAVDQVVTMTRTVPIEVLDPDAGRVYARFLARRTVDVDLAGAAIIRERYAYEHLPPR